MFNKPLRVATYRKLLGVGLLAATAAMPAYAQAAPLAMTVPSAMPLSAIATSQIACHSAPRASAQVTITTPLASKSSAILGGKMSALERLKAQQQAAATARADAASLSATVPAAGAALPVAAVGFNCTLAEPNNIATPAVAQRDGAFLGTERVKIGKTKFDRDWKRVAKKSLSQRDLTQAIGAVPQEREELLSEVNRWVNNSISYRSDKGGDSWADAKATLRKRAGDCEDYAILKMQLLAAAGIAKDDMMLTLARDTLRRIDHAVLLVNNGGEWVMLDMQSNRVAPASQDYGYKPVMSFAGNDSFLHGKKYRAPVDRGPRRLALAN